MWHVRSSARRTRQPPVALERRPTWLHDTLEAECAAVAYAGPQGGVLRPKGVYAVTDSWKVLAGAEILRGQSRSLFGLMERNSAGYAELRWSF